MAEVDKLGYYVQFDQSVQVPVSGWARFLQSCLVLFQCGSREELRVPDLFKKLQGPLSDENLEGEDAWLSDHQELTI